MKPCNNVDETQSQEFIDEMTVLANIVSLNILPDDFKQTSRTKSVT